MATLNRFAYEEAEKILDAYALDPKRRAQYLRSYRKLKFLLTAYARCDFAEGRSPSALAFSYAWEDVQMAFTGYGEPALIGCVLQLWVHTASDEYDTFKQTIASAFAAAEAATDVKVRRRYNKRYRLSAPRTIQEGFSLPTVLPTWGPPLTEWAQDNGHDAVQLREDLAWLEAAERFVQEQEEKKSRQEEEDARRVRKSKSSAKLRVIAPSLEN